MSEYVAERAVAQEDAIELSKEIYGPLGGRFNEAKLCWRMPNGGRVGFKRNPDLSGISILTATLEPKRLELLRELVPQASTIGAFLDPNFPPYEDQLRDLRAAAQSLDLQVHEFRCSTDAEIDLAFKTVVQQRIGAIMITAGPFFDTRREKLVTLAAHYAVPTMYHSREFAAAGGLISYGIDARVIYRQIGVYAGAILKGNRPAELPVLLPTKFELVINLKTAKALGLRVPLTLQVGADEVIE